MKFIKKHLFLTISFAFLISSCASKKDVLYLQHSGSSSSEAVSGYETKIQPDDILSIIVSSENPEAAAPYNLKSVEMQSYSEEIPRRERLQTYVVDKKGAIDFPLLGSITLGGLTKEEAITTLKDKLKEHVKDATVNLRILNFKVTVLGEVQRPGDITIAGERITLLEALGKAGDMTIYGNRKNVLLVRERGGVKTMNRIDITQSDFINSPYYYLVQNDVVYVEPNNTKINSSVIGPNVTVGISVVSLIITVIVLITQ